MEWGLAEANNFVRIRENWMRGVATEDRAEKRTWAGEVLSHNTAVAMRASTQKALNQTTRTSAWLVQEYEPGSNNDNSRLRLLDQNWLLHHWLLIRHLSGGLHSGLGRSVACLRGMKGKDRHLKLSHQWETEIRATEPTLNKRRFGKRYEQQQPHQAGRSRVVGNPYQRFDRTACLMLTLANRKMRIEAFAAAVLPERPGRRPGGKRGATKRASWKKCGVPKLIQSKDSRGVNCSYLHNYRPVAERYAATGRQHLKCQI